jgi:hypothetical protein
LTDESCGSQTFRLFFVQFDHACNFYAIFSAFFVLFSRVSPVANEDRPFGDFPAAGLL